MTDHLQVLYDVLINGTEATDPNWDRLIAASAVEKALKQRKRLAELEAAARKDCDAILDALDRIDWHGQVAWIEPPYQASAVHETVFDRLRSMKERAASSPVLGTEEE